jgi:hypothetical protein
VQLPNLSAQRAELVQHRRPVDYPEAQGAQVGIRGMRSFIPNAHILSDPSGDGPARFSDPRDRRSDKAAQAHILRRQTNPCSAELPQSIGSIPRAGKNLDKRAARQHGISPRTTCYFEAGRLASEETCVAGGQWGNVKAVQELMRHGSVRRTLEIYSQARAMEKRKAHERIVQMIRQGVEQGAPRYRRFRQR